MTATLSTEARARRPRLEALALAFLISLEGGIAGCNDASLAQPTLPPTVLLSTDVATGLIDTHGAQGSCAVSFDADWPYWRDTDVSPQDIDDGLTLAMGLNLDAAGVVVIDAVVPTFGNATLPAEMLVARQIAWTLKGRGDIPIVPGAVGPVSQTIQPTPLWFDGTTVPIDGPDGSFAASCVNRGVGLLRDRILRSERPVTIVAIGPMTDVACLLNVFPEVSYGIAEIVALASRVEGESLTINGKVVNDFNVREDPIATALLLGAVTPVPVPVRLVTFQLSGQTSQSDDLIAFDASTLHGPDPPTPESQRSLDWILRAVAPRNEFWTSVFGTDEGPFDQYALAAVVRPDLFRCRPGRAYIQQCPYPAWSPDYATDADGTPTEIPYNAADNPCQDHGPGETGLSAVPAELVVTFDPADDGPLVRGTTGVFGNLPQLAARARPVVACTDFADDQARGEFEDLLYGFTW